MPETPMLERLARLIATDADSSDESWECYVSTVRAVLAELENPSNAMVDAVAKEIYTLGIVYDGHKEAEVNWPEAKLHMNINPVIYSRPTLAFKMATSAFRAMIRAAKGEG